MQDYKNRVQGYAKANPTLYEQVQAYKKAQARKQEAQRNLAGYAIATIETVATVIIFTSLFMFILIVF